METAEQHRKLIMNGAATALLRSAMPTRPAEVSDCFLYGSVVKPGQFRLDSDVDVALVFRNTVPRSVALAFVTRMNERRLVLLGHPVHFTAMKNWFGMYRHLGGGL